MDQPSDNPEQHPSNELHDAAYPVSDYQPRNIDGNTSSLDDQPGASSSSSQNPQDSKYTELATPALAFTSGQASSSWHGAGTSHLDNALDPPPSYEASQSHPQPQSHPPSQPRPPVHPQSPPATSQPSASNPSILPPNIPPNNNASAPQSPEGTSPNTTTLQPEPTYHPPQPPGPQPGHYPPGPAPNGAPVYGPMPALGYQKPERPTTLDRLRRKSCYTTLLLIGVFLLALFVGLMIGFRDKLDDEDPPDEDNRRSDDNQLFKEAGNVPPSVTVTRTIAHSWA